MTLFEQRPIRPMLSTAGDPFDSEEYIFEPKWDGLRTILFLHNEKLEFQNRNLRDVTPWYPELQEVKDQIRAKSTIIDGEIVILTKKGLPSFHQLQPRFGITNLREAQTLARSTPATFVPFDLLHLNGKDTTNLPLLQRKQMLKTIIHEGPYLLYSEHVTSKEKRVKLERKTPAIEGEVKSNSAIVWVKPTIVCEVEYGSMTDDRKLRFPRFQRLRTDLDPKTIQF